MPPGTRQFWAKFLNSSISATKATNPQTRWDSCRLSRNTSKCGCFGWEIMAMKDEGYETPIARWEGWWEDWFLLVPGGFSSSYMSFFFSLSFSLSLSVSLSLSLSLCPDALYRMYGIWLKLDYRSIHWQCRWIRGEIQRTITRRSCKTVSDTNSSKRVFYKMHSLPLCSWTFKHLSCWVNKSFCLRFNF